MRVLYVLSFMIKRVGCGIKPHITTFTAYLPALWQQSEEHNMLRCAIVSTLVYLEKVYIARILKQFKSRFQLLLQCTTFIVHCAGLRLRERNIGALSSRGRGSELRYQSRRSRLSPRRWSRIVADSFGKCSSSDFSDNGSLPKHATPTWSVV